MKCQCQSPFQNFSYLKIPGENEKLNKTVESLQKKIEKIKYENSELRKINKNLNSKINLLINDNDIVKNVKLDIQDYSDYTNYQNEDTLKEFFYLLVLCEKMKYLNMDHIWMIDSSYLFKEVQNLDMAFYDWPTFISNKLDNENEKFKKNLRSMSNKDSGVIGKLKNLWYDSSVTFFNKIKIIKDPSNNPNQTPPQTNQLSIKNFNSMTTNNSTNSNSTNSKELKKKYLEMLKNKHKEGNNNVNSQNFVKNTNNQFTEHEIEELLLENENSFSETTERNSYNSFLN